MNRLIIFCAILVFCFFVFIITGSVDAESKWPGVDETVVEKFAKQAGRPPREPFINTDQGDLLLFVFLMAGVIGGFVGGYYFRELFPLRVERPQKSRDTQNSCEKNNFSKETKL